MGIEATNNEFTIIYLCEPFKALGKCLAWAVQYPQPRDTDFVMLCKLRAGALGKALWQSLMTLSPRETWKPPFVSSGDEVQILTAFMCGTATVSLSAVGAGEERK